jgi:hypothetical protein
MQIDGQKVMETIPGLHDLAVSLLPVGQSEGHTLMDKSQQAGCACACNSEGCGKNTIQAELVNVQEVVSVAGLIYALKLTVSN